ncbi:MAG: hypothetical protein HYT10_02715 [Candidatus Levybacteria bacterium]|nr:hypothetical protein [Candidatus Levybacteria bacterium]
MAKGKEFMKGIKLNWWQAGIFKSAAVSFGMLLALYFRDILLPFEQLLWIVFVASALYILLLWSKQ